MKKFITINQKDKDCFKMINQSESGFDLIIITEKKLTEFLNIINSSSCDDVYINWQQKFKSQNYTLYKKCTFSEPVDNLFKEIGGDKMIKCGKKIKVHCSSISYYTSNKSFMNKKVRFSTHSYKDSMLLERILKIGELS